MALPTTPTPPGVQPLRFMPGAASSPATQSPLYRRLAAELRGDVLFDTASRGRYATDASIYQVMPIGVVVPRDEADARLALDIARDFKAPLLPRGGGTSQCGQTVGEALVIDNSKLLNQMIDFDPVARTVTVQPGIVLDHLNAWLKPHGLWFPVDVSTAAQCTIGGMAGNNSCGSRSIQYGNMVHNVLGIQAILAGGEDVRFDAGWPADGARTAPSPMACGASPSGSATPSPRCTRTCCGAWAATTSTCSIPRTSAPTLPTAASTSPTCWSARRARWPISGT